MIMNTSNDLIDFGWVGERRRVRKPSDREDDSIDASTQQLFLLPAWGRQTDGFGPHHCQFFLPPIAKELIHANTRHQRGRGRNKLVA